MQIPDTPLETGNLPVLLSSSAAVPESRPHGILQGNDIAVNPHKRKSTNTNTWSFGSSPKRSAGEISPQHDLSPRSGGSPSDLSSSGSIHHPPLKTALVPSSSALSSPTHVTCGTSARSSRDTGSRPMSSLHQNRIRDLVSTVIHEALCVGGRPESSIGQPTLLGERIEVRSRSSSGRAWYQIIEWSVQSNVPDVLPIDGRDLAKLISCLFLNAIKFTENGTVSVMVSLSESLRSLQVNVVDSGSGIPKDFVPQLFKPFSREDYSLTRTREGLGLGLLVAKGLARKLGGDLELVHTAISGQRKGSEFEIKVPIRGVGSEGGTGTHGDQAPKPSASMDQPLDPNPSYPATSFPETALGTSVNLFRQFQNDTRLCTSSSKPSNNYPNSLRRLPSTSSESSTLGGSGVDRRLAEKHPLTFLVAEDNQINRKLLISMLSKLGYKDVHEAFDGGEAVRVMQEVVASKSAGCDREQRPGHRLACRPVDVILMDLWMPGMDGYQATQEIFDIFKPMAANRGSRYTGMAPPTVVAVSADVTDKAIRRATAVGMEGFMKKPYKLVDLQRLIECVCDRNEATQQLSR